MNQEKENHQFTDHYKVLGVDSDASENEIKKKFREKAKVYHPDKGGSSELMKKLNEAYKALIDPNMRKQFDEERDEFGDDQAVHDLPCILGGFKFSDEFRNLFSAFQQKATSIIVKQDFCQMIRNTLKKQIEIIKIESPYVVENFYCEVCQESFISSENHTQLCFDPIYQYLTSLDDKDIKLENLLSDQQKNFKKIIISESTNILDYLNKNCDLINTIFSELKNEEKTDYQPIVFSYKNPLIQQLFKNETIYLSPKTFTNSEVEEIKKIISSELKYTSLKNEDQIQWGKEKVSKFKTGAQLYLTDSKINQYLSQETRPFMQVIDPPIYNQTNTETQCFLCAVKFGIFKWTYQCQLCLQPICSSCEVRRRALIYGFVNEVDICKLCEQVMTMTENESSWVQCAENIHQQRPQQFKQFEFCIIAAVAKNKFGQYLKNLEGNLIKQNSFNHLVLFYKTISITITDLSQRIVKYLQQEEFLIVKFYIQASKHMFRQQVELSTYFMEFTSHYQFTSFQRAMLFSIILKEFNLTSEQFTIFQYFINKNEDYQSIEILLYIISEYLINIPVDFVHNLILNIPQLYPAFISYANRESLLSFIDKLIKVNNIKLIFHFRRLCLSRGVQQTHNHYLINQFAYFDKIPSCLQYIIKTTNFEKALIIAQLLYHFKEMPLINFYQQGFLTEGLLFYKLIDKFTDCHQNWKLLADDFLHVNPDFAFRILEFSEISWFQLGQEYFKEKRFLTCLQCLLQQKQIDPQQIIDLAEKIQDKAYNHLFLFQAYKFTNSSLALQKIILDFNHLSIFPSLVYFLIIKQFQDQQSIISSYQILQDYFKQQNQLSLAFCSAHQAAFLSRQFNQSKSFQGIHKDFYQQLELKFITQLIQPMLMSASNELLIQFKQLDSWQSKSILKYVKQFENVNDENHRLKNNISILKYLASINLNDYSSACDEINYLICKITASDTLLSLSLIMQDSNFRNLGLKYLNDNFKKIIEGKMDFDQLIKFILPQFLQFGDIKISELRWVKLIERGIFRLLKEEDYLEAGFSYLDALVVMPFSTGKSTSILLVSLCFFNQQKRVKTFEESYALFMLIYQLAYIFLEANQTNPIFEFNQLQIYLSILSASSKLLTTINQRMTFNNQISPNTKQIFYQTVTLSEMTDLFEKIIIRILRLYKVTPIMIPFNITLWDSIFVHFKTSTMLETYLNLMKNSQDPILTKLLAEYHLFEGSCKGWVDRAGFQNYRKSLMLSLLKQRGITEQVIKENLLVNSVLKRLKDGWLSPLPELQNLDPKNQYEIITGLVLNYKTGNINFVTCQGDFPVFDINDINEINQKGLYDTFFSLDQPDPQFRYHPFQQMRYGPDRLMGTRFLSTMLHADYLLKMILTGVEVNPTPDFQFKPATEGFLGRLPQHIQNLFREILEKMRYSEQRAHRFWIEGGKIEIQEVYNDFGIQYKLGEAQMIVKKNLLRLDAQGNLVDAVDVDDDSPEAQFANLFTEFYDLIGAYYPELRRLKELYKLAALANKIYELRPRIIEMIQNCQANYREQIQSQLIKMKQDYSQAFYTYEQKSKFFDKIAKTMSAQFHYESSVNSLRKQVDNWFQYGGEQLLDSLVLAKINSEFDQIRNSICSTYFYQEDINFQSNSDSNLKYEWVPAAFCCTPDSRFIYGGVSMFIKTTNSITPQWTLNERGLSIQGNISVKNVKSMSFQPPSDFRVPKEIAKISKQCTLNDYAERVFVIRRPLGNSPIKINILSHSGLLVKCKEKNIYTIIEYMGDGKVHHRQISLNDKNIKSFQDGEFKWSKQKIGKEVINKLKIHEIKDEMEKIMRAKPYGVFVHNCHIAQESVRVALGLVGNNQLTYPLFQNVYEILDHLDPDF